MGKIDGQDVQKLQDFANKVADKLEDLDEFDERIKKNLQKLNGEIGFNLSLMIDRTSRHTQLLDIEVDPTDKQVRRAWNQVRELNIRGFLAALPERSVAVTVMSMLLPAESAAIGTKAW